MSFSAPTSRFVFTATKVTDDHAITAPTQAPDLAGWIWADGNAQTPAAAHTDVARDAVYDLPDMYW